MSTNSKILNRLMSLFANKDEQQEYDTESSSTGEKEQLIHNVISDASMRALSVSAASPNKVHEVSMSFTFSGGQTMNFHILMNENGMLTYNTKVSEMIDGVQNTVLEYVDTHGDDLGSPISQTLN